MATPINMPKLGLSMKEGTVGKWLKNEGDSVKKGDVLLEVMTDKISNKIEAPADGTLLKIIAAKKAKLPVGGLLGVIGSTGEDISELIAAANIGNSAPAADKAPAGKAVTVSTVKAPGAKVKISPAARVLAEANDIDYSQLAGTGPEGRIVREDIEQAIADKNAAKDRRATIEVIPYEGMRQVIGENMANSWTIAPKVTHHTDVDLTALQTLRATINADVKDNDKVSVTDILVKAVAKALEIHPKINSTLNGEEILVLQDINIGVAIAIPDGLVVPVVKNANKKSLADVSKEIKDFAKRARKNKLDPEEMTAGTFTVTNLGGYGSVDYFTPIINQPESAILGVGRTVKKPVVAGEQIVIRPIMGLSLAFDHRVIDGAPAAEFLAVLIKLIEQPHRIFI
ncbi:dihydrolipoamide acetyltransferase family protein [Sporomusa acidovorans]|uniref:Dihydrolipoamide acetyltransferase component of pyruvate dehydrogenase complex n=1 Tax=Sporomusa acidovorans (strain ATCC 49682 / DSM 3132 / Mol) TaxID=1123286 RepID=A0ABZ3J5W7_SPOA4|nr:dihydrolipoamide acetyltransferase family protein [Sporomusa acidovorans]OZC15651.1 dihydrolipoyllysine-residue acetyltransferase component of pyruvate dehydrogenase complex [Sporomusa acidovorans DSM 3132]SDE88213.1 pyruvate dehydrogenase E2 component (dihydrolipoamide acetyltransferase) [Sporomusa acidovorans]